MANIPVKEHGDLEHIINDVRDASDFRSETFSGYKRTEVKKEMFNSIYNGKIEPACYWCAELICTGHFMDIWELILFYTCKHIHLGNPMLPVYINLRFQNFKEILNLGYVNNELAMRNNDKVRKLFNEIICVLCTSMKQHSYETIRVKQEDFNMNILSEKLKAPSVHYIDSIFQIGDPKEFFIPLKSFI